MKKALLLLCLLCLLTGCARPEPQWWEGYVCVQALREAGLTGKGVLIAVLDSGIDDHPSLKKLDVLEKPQDELGHGTFVVGLLAELMPEAKYLPIKITETGRDIEVSAIVRGLEYALKQEADVAVLSLGMEEDVPEVQEAISALTANGCLVFAAVGNDGTDTLYYPAAYEEVIGVGSCNLEFEPSASSQYNESVFLLAPGVKLKGPWLNGNSQILKGTSYAVPIAAATGVAAKACDPKITAEEFLSLLQGCTTDICEPGYDVRSGWGIVNFEKLCDELTKQEQEFR